MQTIINNPLAMTALSFLYIVGSAWIFAVLFSGPRTDLRRGAFCLMLWANLFIVILSDGRVF